MSLACDNQILVKLVWPGKYSTEKVIQHKKVFFKIMAGDKNDESKSVKS